MKRITLFAGHYGSGKTNIAVNYAIDLRKKYDKVLIADLDVVNPYFRTKDSEKELKENDIRLISSAYANSNLDIPAIPQDMYAVVDETDTYAVMDIGGDDRGAFALGRYAPKMLEEDNYEMFLVINKYRPLTSDVNSLLEVVDEIQKAAGMRFTAIVNNSNLGEETTAQDVLDTVDFAREIGEKLMLPVKMTTVKDNLYNELSEKIDNVFPLKLQKKIN